MEHFRICDTIDSTNKEALRLLASGQNLHGTAILALHQTGGLGQYGRSWLSEPGQHLAMSVILQSEKLLPGDLPLLAMQSSVAVVRTILLTEPAIQPLIKWPNDIYIDHRKIAGILIENSISAIKVRYSVIGIGININEAQFPKDLPNAVSLFMLTGKNYHIDSIAFTLREQLLKVLDESIQSWKPEYDHLIYGLGKTHDFILDGKTVPAKIHGVNEAGRIDLDIEGGAHGSYFSHEIKWAK